MGVWVGIYEHNFAGFGQDEENIGNQEGLSMSISTSFPLTSAIGWVYTSKNPIVQSIQIALL